MFSKKERAEYREDMKPVIERYEKEIAEIKKFRDIGEKFNYLGLDMIVLSHSYREIDMEYGSWYSTPKLRAKYVNAAKEIVIAKFDYEELPALVNENPID